MVSGLESRELDRLIGALGTLYVAADLETLPGQIFAAIQQLVPSDVASYNRVDTRRSENSYLTDPPEAIPPEMDAPFTHHIEEHPLIDHYSRTQDPRARRISDCLSPRAFHRLGLYGEFFRPMRIEHQLAVTVVNQPGAIVGVALNRSRGDFSDSERLMLDLLRPHLQQAHRNAEVMTRLKAALRLARRTFEIGDNQEDMARLGLSKREAEVLQLVAEGQTNREVAETLGISARTVQKHLEHIYETFKVHNRGSAVALLRRS